MSHSTVAVITKRGTETEIEKALEPYFEGWEAPPYLRRCWCVGRKAEERARKAADKQVGTIESLREKMRTLRGPQLKEEDDLEWSREPLNDEQKARYKLLHRENEAAWRELLAPREAAEKAVLDADPQREAADLSCEECGGKGLEESTYNPMSKWDWYAIGGRWAGKFAGKDSATVGMVRGALAGGKDWRTFAILTHENVWHEKGRMGWFGMVADENLEWEVEFDRILAALPANLMVTVVDVHI